MSEKSWTDEGVGGDGVGGRYPPSKSTLGLLYMVYITWLENIGPFHMVLLRQSDVPAFDCASNSSQVPLPDSSVDVAVFCLSLMGTNLVEYLREAHRVLRKGYGLGKHASEQRLNVHSMKLKHFGQIAHENEFLMKRQLP